MFGTNAGSPHCNITTINKELYTLPYGMCVDPDSSVAVRMFRVCVCLAVLSLHRGTVLLHRLHIQQNTCQCWSNVRPTINVITDKYNAIQYNTYSMLKIIIISK